MTEQFEAMVGSWWILSCVGRLIARAFRGIADRRRMVWMPVMALPCLAVTLMVVTIPTAVADPNGPATRTGKERLSDKASDEQRLDDCKVPLNRRTRTRPTACPWDAGT